MKCVKISYENRQEAKKAIKYFNNKFNIRNIPYKCPECGKLHLTTRGNNK